MSIGYPGFNTGGTSTGAVGEATSGGGDFGMVFGNNAPPPQSALSYLPLIILIINIFALQLAVHCDSV